jgi:hypothetical protein
MKATLHRHHRDALEQPADQLPRMAGDARLGHPRDLAIRNGDAVAE